MKNIFIRGMTFKWKISITVSHLEFRDGICREYHKLSNEMKWYSHEFFHIIRAKHHLCENNNRVGLVSLSSL